MTNETEMTKTEKLVESKVFDIVSLTIVGIVFIFLLYGAGLYKFKYENLEPTKTVVLEGPVTVKRTVEVSCGTKGRNTCLNYYLGTGDGRTAKVSQETYAFTDIGDNVKFHTSDTSTSDSNAQFFTGVAYILLCIMTFMATIIFIVYMYASIVRKYLKKKLDSKKEI